MILGIIIVIILMVIVLRWMGREWYRKGKNSGGIGDIYTLSHFLHGVLFRLVGLPLLVSVVLECGWEVYENTNRVIRKYRRRGHPDYAGDSVVNSVCDVLACIGGWYYSDCLYWPWVVLTVILVEIGMYLFWGDNLLLNIWAIFRP